MKCGANFNQHVVKILDTGVGKTSDEECSRQKLHRIGENPFVLTNLVMYKLNQTVRILPPLGIISGKGTQFFGVGAYEAQAIDCQSIESRCKSDAPRHFYMSKNKRKY